VARDFDRESTLAEPNTTGTTESHHVMNTRKNKWIVTLAICALLMPCASASDKIERPFKMRAQGTLVASLIDGSYAAAESGQATHTGRLANEYSGYLDLQTLLFASGAGVMTASNGDELSWEVSGPSGAGVFTGGTGRFEGATGALTWVVTDLTISFDLNSMTVTMVYVYTGSGTITY
jgi:hypothetical protein